MISKTGRFSKGMFHEMIQFELCKKARPNFNWEHISRSEPLALYDSSFELDGKLGYIDFRQREESAHRYIEHGGIYINVDKFEFAINNRKTNCYLMIYFDNVGCYLARIGGDNICESEPFSVMYRKCNTGRHHKVVAHLREFELIFSDEIYKEEMNK